MPDDHAYPMQAGIHGTDGGIAIEGSMDSIVHGNAYPCHCYTDIIMNWFAYCIYPDYHIKRLFSCSSFKNPHRSFKFQFSRLIFFTLYIQFQNPEVSAI